MAVISDMTYDARVAREARTLAQAGHGVTIVSMGTARPLERYQRGYVRHIAIPFSLTSGKRVSGFLARFAAAVIGQAADIYHAHNVNTMPFCYAAARFRGVPVVYDSHELFAGLLDAPQWSFARIKQIVERATEAALIRRVDGVITVSPSYAERLTARYGTSTPVILRNVPPLVPMRPNRSLHARLNLPEDTRLVLYQGGFYLDTRALLETVDAAAFLPANIHLVFLGFGVRGEDEQLRARILQQGTAHRVHVLPPVPHDELLEYTMGADVGLIPFYDNSEAMHLCTPNKVYEYLMAGLAVACTDLPELRRVVAGERVGTFFDPRNPRSIANAVVEIMSHGLDEIKVRARQAAEREYHWGIEANKLVALYERLGLREP